MKWISFEEQEPDVESDILVYDGNKIVLHDPLYISYDAFEDWDPMPKYWIYVADIIKGIN